MGGIPEQQRRRFLTEALEIVGAARRITLARMAGGFARWKKADQSFVTDADLEVERLFRSELARRFPEHGIVGEEFEPVNPEADFQWIVDPIDGTLSFTRGIPLFGTIVGLHHRGTPIVGIIDHPALGRCYSAAAGLGAFRDGERIRLHDLAPDERVEDEPIASGDRHQFLRSDRGEAFDALMRGHPRVRTYADCFGHTLAAEGAVGAMVDFGLRIWDLAATQVLIEEAGGRYVCAQTLERPGEGTLYGIICGKPRVVEWLLPRFT